MEETPSPFLLILKRPKDIELHGELAQKVLKAFLEQTVSANDVEEHKDGQQTT